MKRLNHKIILLFLLVMGFFHPILGAEEIEISKRIVNSFKVAQNVQVDISNKYGNVIINTWEKDSVKFVVKMVAYGKTDEAAEKLIERVDFEYTNSGKFLTFETVFDRQSGSFKEFWNSLGDYSKVLINKNNLHIDYEIYLPARSNLYLENKFGDVYINEYSGRTKIVLSQGDLKASKLSGQLNLDLKFGKANLQNLGLALLDLQIAEVNITKVRTLTISSSSSTVRVTEAEKIKIDSRNDKYYLGSVNSISGDATFSNITVSNLNTELIGSTNYSDIMIEDFSKNGKLINLNSKSSDLKIWISPSNTYDVDLISKEDKLDVPLDWKELDTQFTDSNKKYIRLSGITGSDADVKIHIDNQGGSLSIYKK